MGFIEKTEKKFGKFAIPGLTMKLAAMQIIMFVIYMLNMKTKTVGNQLYYDNSQIVDIIYKLNIGETTFISDLIFIIGSPAVLPSGILSYIFFYFAIYLLMLFGNSLEELWGKYKYNLYVFTSIILAFISSQSLKWAHPEIYGHQELIYFTSTLYMSIFFAFATYFPKFQLLLFFILPTPVRFLALLGAGGIFVFLIWTEGVSNFDRFFWILGAFGAYIPFHYHLIANAQAQKARKANFEKKIGKLDSQPFHRCAVCGKTENDDDSLEFRIADDGEEYCLEHLDKK